MNREQIDILWSQALAQSVKAGEQFTRYHFAALVAAASASVEREACAQVCEEIASSGENTDNWTITRDKAFHDCAAAIRARGKA
jgi:hypothetical protein